MLCQNSILIVQKSNNILCQFKFLELRSVATNYPNLDDLSILKVDNLLQFNF